MTPDLDGRDQQNGRQGGEQLSRRHQSEELPADECADDGLGRHEKQERPVAAEDGKAAVPTVACEADEHRRQADCQRQAPGELDVDPEQQDQGGYQQLAPGDAEQGRDDADPEPGEDAGGHLGGSGDEGAPKADS